MIKTAFLDELYKIKTAGVRAGLATGLSASLNMKKWKYRAQNQLREMRSQG